MHINIRMPSGCILLDTSQKGGPRYGHTHLIDFDESLKTPNHTFGHLTCVHSPRSPTRLKAESPCTKNKVTPNQHIQPLSHACSESTQLLQRYRYLHHDMRLLALSYFGLQVVFLTANKTEETIQRFRLQLISPHPGLSNRNFGETFSVTVRFSNRTPSCGWIHERVARK